ncbi:hypothetical protein LTR66_009837 [Elasticomyces elasticus]|nr:hypothetical protein LTR66_009837 [Elasticomyces elasticus]
MKELEAHLRTEMKYAQAVYEEKSDQRKSPAPAYKVSDLVWLNGKTIKTTRPSLLVLRFVNYSCTQLKWQSGRVRDITVQGHMLSRMLNFKSWDDFLIRLFRIKAYMKDGTYYSEPLFEGLGDPQKHKIAIDGETTGQEYITAVATRAITFFEADSPAIGLIAFMGVGTAEASTREITVMEGQHVKKGDQIGMIHFGGSTHCILFCKGVDVLGFPEPGKKKEGVLVRSKLAVVKS